MRLIICGTGAMSCLFGARLASVADITLIGTWKMAIEAIRKQGITVETGSAETTIPVSAALLGTPTDPADLVLVLVKAWQNESISPCLPSLLKPEGIILTLQNGLGNREALGPRAYLGVTTEGATLLAPGRVRHGGAGQTHIAAPEWVVKILQDAGFETYCCDASEADRLLWGKLLANCGINPLTALLRISNGELLERPDALALLDRAAEECAAVAQAKGIILPFAEPALRARDVARRTAANTSSMLQDIMRGAPTETDVINGALVKEGERLGIPTPVNQTLWRLVRATVRTSDPHLKQ